MTPGSLYWPARLATAPLRRAWLDVDWQSVGNVPSEGPVVLAANHLSFIDSPLLMFGLGRKILFLGKAEYTERWHTRFFPAAGMIPVDRGGKGVAVSLAQAASVLESGGAIGIFPEGTRSRDGRIGSGHSGAAHLALRTSAALVPVGIAGTDEAQPPGSLIPRRKTPISIRFGAPIDLAGHGSGATARRAVTDELMQSIAVLANRSYTPSNRRSVPAPKALAADVK